MVARKVLSFDIEKEAQYLKKFHLKKYIVCFWAEDGGFWLTEVLFYKNWSKHVNM